MGKNQAYKAMQRSRVGSSNGNPDEVEDGMIRSYYIQKTYLLNFAEIDSVLKWLCIIKEYLYSQVLKVDGSFHTPEWHAARLANLKTSHTVTWEEFKQKQKEDAVKRGELEADKDRMMKEYRAQLDAERERKLSQGRNHSSSKSKHKKDKEKSSKKRSSKKRKHSKRRTSDSSSSSSSSEYSSSDEEERESRRSKSRSKRTKKERKHRSRSKISGSEGEEADGPLPLSRFFGNVKS